MAVLVSAFLSNVNHKYSNALERYYQLGNLFLQSPVRKIVFVDDAMKVRIGNDFDPAHTVLVTVAKEALYLQDYAASLSEFDVHSTDKTKDTQEFMFTMCSKTEWVRKAIEQRPFDDCDHYVWVDFGIRHVFKCSDEAFQKKLETLAAKPCTRDGAVRIGGIWNLANRYDFDVYKDVAWYFAGGVFGGRSDVLIAFAEAMKQKCVEIMTTKKTIMWEVNVWYLLYTERSVTFDVYKCDHNDSLVENY